MKKTSMLLLISFLALIGTQAGCAFLAGKDPTPSPAPTLEAPTIMPQDAGACAPPIPPVTASGIITEVTLAKSTEENTMKPVDPTSVFSPQDIFHAVVAVQDAPEDTHFKASWYAVDVGSVAECNTYIDSDEITTTGTRNLDFSLTPDQSWPAGIFRVEIAVNDVLDSVQIFSVR